MRDPTRHLAERAQPLRLELALARGFERRRELAQRLAQRFEFRSPARRRTRRQRHASPDHSRPADELVDRTGELAREVAHQTHCRDDRERAEHEDDRREAAGVVAQVRLRAARQGHGVGELLEMLPEGRPLPRRQVGRVHPIHHQACGRRHFLERHARPRRRRHRAHRERPAYDGQGGRHSGQRHQDQEDPLAEGEGHI